MSKSEMYDTRPGRSMNSAHNLEAWVGNSLAAILATLAVASGVIGLLVAFGYLNGDAINPFQNGLVWLVGGLILGVAGNVFRREHQIATASEADHRAGMALGNGLATILALLSIAAGVVGLLVAFGYIHGDAVNSFQDGIVWMIGGLILGIAGNVYRREHRIESTFDERPAASERTMRYDSERPVRSDTEAPVARENREYVESTERNRRS